MARWQRVIASLNGVFFLCLGGTLVSCSSDENPPAGSAGTAGTGGNAPQGCTGPALPAVSDYGERGPFEVTQVNDTGPNNQYTMFRPTTLGANGFKHPPTTWGNGITTTPAAYVPLLSTIASHGFVVIASNSTTVNAALMTQGFDWLIAQNDAVGDFQGKLAVNCGVAIGYSLGGGGAVNSGSHPSIVTTVSFHGLAGPSENLNGPLLLMTSPNDPVVSKAGFVQPTYDRSSKVPTVLATLVPIDPPPLDNEHLIPLNDAGLERAPAVAWLRYWVYADQGARPYFFGSDCTLCKSPWIDLQRKNAEW